MSDMPRRRRVADDPAAAIDASDYAIGVHMLRTLLVMATALSTFTFLSSALGAGTYTSVPLALAYVLLDGGTLAAAYLVPRRWLRYLAWLLTGSVVTHYSVGYLVAPPQDALVGVLVTLLFLPVVMIVLSMFGFTRRRTLPRALAAFMGTVAVIGAQRPVLVADGFDWRFGPLLVVAMLVLDHYLAIWSKQRTRLVESAARQAHLELDLELARIEAETDTLTSLGNRRAAASTLVDWDRVGHRYAIILLDVDRFKSVNDTYGHDVGDQVLSFVADVVGDLATPSGRAFRWGGEEFLVLLDGLDHVGARSVADRMRAEIEARSRTDAPVAVTASFGVASHAAGSDDRPDDVVHHADAALYAAKSAGRNRVVVHDTARVA